MGFPSKGRADYWAPGDWNCACSMCGRKRKASELVRNWQGMYRCPEHNEERQPQDFVRNVKDIMTVPFDQPETQLFVSFTPTFPLKISSTTIKLLAVDLALESGPILDTEGGVALTLEGPWVFPLVQALYPSWVTVKTIAWSWASGGVGITISNPAGEATSLSAAVFPVSGILQLTVTSTLGAVAVVTASVSS